jgi:hypothetical protein
MLGMTVDLAIETIQYAFRRFLGWHPRTLSFYYIDWIHWNVVLT